MRARVVVAIASAVAVLAGCAGGGDTAREAAREDYRAYRAAEDERTDAERRLRRAFADIADADKRHDRASVIAAVGRGRAAAGDVERLLAQELAAAAGLVRYEATRGDGRRLRDGLRTTRAALWLIQEELEIGARDPFLDRAVNARRIRVLARVSVTLSTRGELAVRRADRAIAEELDLEPRFDPLFDRGGSTP